MLALASTPCAGANGDTLAITGLLGRGSYGAVYHGFVRSRGFVAVKVVPLGTDGKEKVLEEVCRAWAPTSGGAAARGVHAQRAGVDAARACVGSARRDAGGAPVAPPARRVRRRAARLRHLHDGCGVVHRT